MSNEDGATFSVTLLTPEADTVFARTYRAPKVAIPKSVVDSVVEAKTRRLQPELAAAYKRDAYIPAFYPTVSHVVLGTDGVTFLQLQRTADAQRYLLLNEYGEPQGTLTLPAATTVVAGNRTTVWALEENEFKVQSVVKYAIDTPKFMKH